MQLILKMSATDKRVGLLRNLRSQRHSQLYSVNFGNDCTLSHPAEFPLIVSARHCSRERGNFKAKITGLTEQTDRHKIVLQLLAVFVLLTERHTNINIPMWFRV